MDVKEFHTSKGCEDGAEMRVYNEKLGQMSDVYITVRGIDSDAYREAIQVQRLAAFTDSYSRERTVITERERDLAVAATIGWKGLEKNGKELEFNEKECLNLYKQAPYIVDQVIKFAEKRANFTTG
jgi:hypothetical protein